MSDETSLYFSRGRMLWKVMRNEDDACWKGKLFPDQKHRCINSHHPRVFLWVTKNVLWTNTVLKQCGGHQIYNTDSGIHNTFDCQIWNPSLLNPELSSRILESCENLESEDMWDLESTPVIQNPRRWERNVERCIRWYKRFHILSTPHSILQIFTALVLILVVTHFTRVQPRVEIGKRADGCVKIRLKGTLCLLKRKMNGSSWKVLSKVSKQ